MTRAIKRNTLGLIVLAISIVGLIAVSGIRDAKLPSGSVKKNIQVRGMTIDARSQPSDSSIAALADLGVTHLSVTPLGWQMAFDDPVVHRNSDARWFTESDAGVRQVAQIAAASDMAVIIKPHIWLRDGAASEFYSGAEVTKPWRGDILFETEEEWQMWEESYHAFIMHYARLANEVGAFGLTIGTELSKTERAREKFWRLLIKDVRAVFRGKIIYAANWYGDYQLVPFWDAVDFVGIQAYFPIAELSDPALSDLLVGWREHAERIREIAVRTDRPVLFTEIGYRSVTHAARTPWVWPNRAERGVVEPDSALQARLFEAFFQTFWDEPWFGGAIVWKWHPGSMRGPRTSLDFSPQGKPAEKVIRTWYQRDLSN